MKITKALFFAALVTICFFARGAFAEAPVASIIAVVDTNKVLQETNAAKGIFAELDKKREEYQSQITKEENKLRAAEKEIIKKKEKLSKEEFEKNRISFEKSVAEGQKMVQDKKRTLDKAHAESMAKLRTEISKVVAAIAKEKGVAIVLTQESVMLVAPEFNITEDVIKKLNSSLKKIPIDWSSAKSAEPEKK